MVDGNSSEQGNNSTLSKSNPDQGGIRVKRRSIVKGILAVGAGGLLAQEVIQGVEQKVETPNANFYPFYQQIGADLTSRPLPANLDFHWNENVYPYNPDYIQHYADNDPKGKSNLSFLSSIGACYGGGDIYINIDSFKDIGQIVGILRPPGGEVDTNSEQYKLHFYSFLYSTVFLPSRIGFEKIIKGKKPDSANLPATLNRRQMLIKSGVSIVDAAALYLTANGLVGAEWAKSDGFKNWLGSDNLLVKAADRVADRMYGLISYTKPFDLEVFLRNLLWAHKLLDLSEKESKRLGRKVNISYQVGRGHEGMEDFIILGKTFCSNLLNLFPSDVYEIIRSAQPGLTLETHAETVIATPKSKTAQPMDADWNQREIIDEDLLKIMESKLIKTDIQ